jgi:N-carbamoyl-L-amino-acid hydrolase
LIRENPCQKKSMSSTLNINIARIEQKIRQLGAIGALPGGGVSRLALTDEDKAARDWLLSCMKQLQLDIRIDELGNMFGIRPGKTDGPPVMVGSHLDTVGTGGLYDGSLGVLAGLEIVEVLNEHNITTEKPFAVANFTNEEGVRFTPDMMGSHGFSQPGTVSTLLDAPAVDGSGATVKSELQRIGYAGKVPCGSFAVDTFLELHIEQGPVLETEGIQIGAVEMVQGIYWTEYLIEGVANHAGTTPMPLRRDAGLVAAQLASFVRELAFTLGGNQVGTVGLIELHPNLINVMAEKARIIVDQRNTDEASLAQAQILLDKKVAELAKAEEVKVQKKELVRFPPVQFDPGLVKQIKNSARQLGFSVQQMPSGAGHDAQMMAAACPTAMIFVPSVGGISHNIKEFTKLEDIERGCQVLLNVVLNTLSSK